MSARATLAFVLLALIVPAGLPAQSRQVEGSRSRGTAAIAGRIINADGSAAANARVVVYAVREGAPAAVIGTTTSAHDGRYEVTRLVAGPVMVGVTAFTRGGFGGDTRRPGSVPVETFYPGVADRDRAQPIALFDGISTEGIDVWLAPAPQRFTISGRIVWPDGTTVEGAVIEYGGPDAIRRGIWYVHDPGGLFTIEGVAQGTYVLLARAESSEGPLIGLAATDVAIGPVEDVRLMLRAPGTIEGRITTEGAQAPMPFTDLRIAAVQMLLTLSPVYPRADADVGADGRFAVPYLAGEYTLSVSGLPAGWRVKRILQHGAPVPGGRIRVGAGERLTVDVVVGTGST